MKHILYATLLTFAASASAADYVIDEAHTNARFAIDHFQTSTNVGGFYGLSGQMQFDQQKQTGQVTLNIPMSRLQTGSEHFTNHLKSEDLFNATQFPEMIFRSTKFVFDGKRVQRVEGELTLLGKTHSVTLTADKFNCYHNPMFEAEVCGGDFRTTIDRTQWGMNYLVSMGMSKQVDIQIQIEAVKK